MCDLNGKRCASGLMSSCHKRFKESFEKDGPNTSQTLITTASATSPFMSSTSSCPSPASSVCNESERLQPVASTDDSKFRPVATPLEYSDGLPLQPEELLLYSLMKICAPGNNINSVKGFSPEKFQGVSNAIWNVCAVYFNCVTLRNYFYRSINNAKKGLGKFKGILRWRYFNHDVDIISVKYHQVLVNLLTNNYSVSAQSYKDLKDDLNLATVSNAKELNRFSSLAYKVSTIGNFVDGKSWQILRIWRYICCIWGKVLLRWNTKF